MMNARVRIPIDTDSDAGDGTTEDTAPQATGEHAGAVVSDGFLAASDDLDLAGRHCRPTEG
jgi:hypothetical protein